MQFGIEKYAVLILKRGKVLHSDGIELTGDNKINTLKDGGLQIPEGHGGKRAAP